MPRYVAKGDKIFPGRVADDHVIGSPLGGDVAEHQPAEPTTTIIYEKGDAYVLLTNNNDSVAKRFLVSAQTLAVASSVMETLFRVTSMVAGEKPKVKLPNHDPAAMKTLLRVLHHAPGSIAESITAEELLQVVLLADKYGCCEVMRPWVYFCMTAYITERWAWSLWLPDHVRVRLLINRIVKLPRRRGVLTNVGKRLFVAPLRGHQEDRASRRASMHIEG